LEDRLKRRASTAQTGEPTWEPWVVAAVMVITLALLFWELWPPYAVMLGALAVVWNLGILSSAQAVSGFSNPALVSLGALYVVSKGVDRARLIDRIARACLGKDSTQEVARMRIGILSFIVGAFLNNTPVVAILMPIIRDWCRQRDFAPSKFLIPMAYASVAGGFLTLMGQSSNLMVNGMMFEVTGESFGFFDPALVGVVVGLASGGYLLTIGVRMLPDRRGGLFRTLKERTNEMVTELQVAKECPLVGMGIFDALDQLSIPRAALFKVFRTPNKKESTPRTPRGRRRSKGSVMVRSESSGFVEAAVRRVTFAGGSGAVSEDEFRSSRALYSQRTGQYWGTLPTSRQGAARRLRTQSEQIPETSSWHGMPMAKIAGLEIFPVMEHEVLEGGDILFLSLPQKDCIALVGSKHVKDVLHDLRMQELLEMSRQEANPTMVLPGTLTSVPSGQVAAQLSSGSAGGGILRTGRKEVRESVLSEQEEHEDIGNTLRICEVDLLEVPGRESDFVELVVSSSNPFIGRLFGGKVREEFEKHYGVAVMAIRHTLANCTSERAGAEGDQLPSKMNSSVQAFQRVLAHPEVGSSLRRLPSRQQRQGQSLTAGDTVLVLAKMDDCERFQESYEFLAATSVAAKQVESDNLLDYVPFLLFVVAIVLISVDEVSTAQAMVCLMVVYILAGWVDAAQVRECVDWNALVLIGSALGLAQAVQVSGLSNKMANLVRSFDLGTTGTVFTLFLFTSLLAEMLNSNAAAAVAFPLAVDLSISLGLKSVKPLSMTVMIAAATTFINPIASPAVLMVMGPGGYKLTDFLKVGVIMDLVAFVTCCTLVPVFFPMV